MFRSTVFFTNRALMYVCMSPPMVNNTILHNAQCICTGSISARDIGNSKTPIVEQKNNVDLSLLSLDCPGLAGAVVCAHI